MNNKLHTVDFGGEIKKTLSFSINFVDMLQELVGTDFVSWATNIELGSELEQGKATCDLVYAAMKAYDLEEGNTIDYNIYKVRRWVTGMSEDEMQKLLAAVSFNTKPPIPEGK